MHTKRIIAVEIGSAIVQIRTFLKAQIYSTPKHCATANGLLVFVVSEIYQSIRHPQVFR